jgi:hypothetical protein
MEELNKDTIIIIDKPQLVECYKSNNENNIYLIELKNEIIGLKKEINEIKNVMKEMSVIIKTVYLFEYQHQIKD